MCVNNNNIQRNTINDKRSCYDFVTREIVTKLDALSNCNEINLNVDKKNYLIREGPDFINENSLETYNNKNSKSYNFLNNTQSDYYFSINNSYSDVSINSDPTYVYLLSKNNKKK